jgi:prevent-host-death family protein
MESVRANEAKAHLSTLLRRVAAGEEFVITRRGVPIAKLVPVDRKRESDVRAAISALRELRKGHTLGGLKIRDMIEKGRH